MNQKIYALYNLKNSIPSFTQLLLFFNYSISKNNIIIFLMIMPKFLSILIISSKFNWILNDDYKSKFYVTNYLRKLKLINVFPILNELSYYILVGIFFLIELIFFSFCLYYYIKIKLKKGKKLIIHFIPKYLFYFNLFFSQYLIEFFSFSFLLVIKNKIHIPKSEIFNHYKNIIVFNSEKYQNKILIIILFVIEFFMIVLLNLFIYYSFLIMNTQFRQKEITLKITHYYVFFYFVLYSDLFCIEYYEIFLGEYGRKLYNIFLYLILGFLLLFDVIKNIRTYEIENFFYMIIKFFNTYNLISLIFEFISNAKDFKFSIFEIYSYTSFKFIIALFYMKYFLTKGNNYIINISKRFLFEQYEDNNLLNILECFNYYLDQLILIKNHNIKGNDIFKIIIVHQKNCENENCKCKEININSSLSFENNERVTYNLSKIFEFLMETTFIHNKNIFKNIEFILFLSEYYYHVKNNLIISYSLIQTALLNKHHLNFIDIFELNRFIQFYKNDFKLKLEKNKDHLQFYQILNNLFSKEDFKKNILKYCNCFLELIDFKIIYENSLRFTFEHSTNEILEIKSKFINRKNLRRLVNKLIYLSKKYEFIAKELIKKKNERNEYDFYYIIFLFYQIFSIQYPKEFVKLCEGLKLNKDIFTNIEYEDMTYKFDKLINKYILNQSSSNHIIIKFSKGIKIKYISSYLCYKLNFKKNIILNEDFFNIFPKNLRIKHHKAIMHYIIVEQKITIKKNTFIFDSNYNMHSCEIMGNIIPHYGKSLLMIINLNFKEKDENYYFMIDEKFSCISMSKNFEENYFLNSNILRKFEISIIDLLNVKSKIIKNYFKKSLNEIKKIDKFLKKNNTEYYANNLFSLHSLDNFDYHFLFIPENDFNKFNKKVLFLNENENEDDYEFTLEKSSLIENLLNVATKLRDSEFKENLVNNLTKKLLHYQKVIKKDLPFDKLFTLKKINNTFSTDEDSLNFENKNFYLQFYIKIKKLYNIPLYIILFQDINSDNININNETMNYDKKFPKITEKNNSIYNKNLNNSMSDLSIFSSNTNKSLLKNSRKKKYSILNKKFYNNNIDLINDNNIDLFDLKEQNKKKKTINSTVYIKFEIVIIFLTFYCIILSLANLIYQLYRIKRINNSISFLNHNSFLEHKINSIQHGLFTSAFYYIGLNNLSITNDELKEYLRLLASDLISSAKEYYDFMAMFAVKYELNFLPYTQASYIKVGLSWKNESFESDMFKEYYYINYYINKFNEDNENDIKYDIELLFNQKYLLNETIIIRTNFARVVYFLVTNFDITFRNTLDSLYYILLDENFIFLDKSLNKIIIMEIFWCIGCISIFLSIFILYFYYNKNLFIYMIKMFFNKMKEKNNLKKNITENLYMKLKVSYFINFVKIINQENKLKILNIKNIFYKEKLKIEEINNENNLIIENKENKSKLQIESPQIKLLKKDNDSLKEKNIQKKNLINFNFIDDSFNLDNSNSKINNNNKKDENKNTLNNNDLLYFLNKNRPILNYLIIIIVLVLFLINILIFYIHILGIIEFTNNNNYMLHCFDNYVTYIWALPFTLNTIRRNIMFNNPIEKNILNYFYEIQKYLNNLYSLNQQKNYNIYDKIKYIWHQMNIPLNDKDIDIDYICLNYDLCKKYIQREDSYSQGGTILGYNLIANEINIIINDYSNLKAKYDSKNEIIPREILKEFIFTENFIKIQEHIDIIYSRVENRFYYSFFHDYEKNNDKMCDKIIFFNIIFFIYEILVIIILLILIFFYMKKKETKVKDGAYLFNSAFFKDYEEI